LLGTPGKTQTTKRPTPQEQSGFNYDLEIDQIQRPAELSTPALQTLSKDELIHSCLESEGLSSEQLPANWFVASEIHLDGPNEIDLIVLPGGRLPDTPPGEISKNACLGGANTAGFWILRKTPLGFLLVLTEMALKLDVLRTRSHGFRDIRLYTISLSSILIQDFRFDGSRYVLSQKKSRPNS
jgi:hypothetical protein